MSAEIELSNEAQSLPLGHYRHYKGGEYEVLGVGIHSETLEEMVIYKALYGKGLTWLRPLKMFFDTVDVNGHKEPRFKYLGK